MSVICIDLSVQLFSHAVINMLVLLCANKYGWMDGSWGYQVVTFYDFRTVPASDGQIFSRSDLQQQRRSVL